MSLAANPSESASTMQYEGSISSDGKFHGRGSIVYSNGERYAGEWQYGQRHGRGTYTYADGGTYSGADVSYSGVDLLRPLQRDRQRRAGQRGGRHHVHGADHHLGHDQRQDL